MSSPASSPTQFHPWRQLLEQHPNWSVIVATLPGDLLGGTDHDRAVIYLNSRQLQAQRRCTLTHEIVHMERAHRGCQPRETERAVELEAARRLIPFDALLDAWTWAYDLSELADELWVDLATLRTRVDNLLPDQVAAVRFALARRDFHEEGMT